MVLSTCDAEPQTTYEAKQQNHICHVDRNQPQSNTVHNTNYVLYN